MQRPPISPDHISIPPLPPLPPSLIPPHSLSHSTDADPINSYLNFVANCLIGHIDHSARVMRVITWNWSFRGLPNVDDGKDDFDSEEH